MRAADDNHDKIQTGQPAMTTESPLLSIERLSVQFGRQGAYTEVVHDVSFAIAPGEKLALVGESGSGKTVTALSILQLHDPTQVNYTQGTIHYAGKDLLRLEEHAIRQIRGRDIAMIFQEPMTAFNPVQPVGAQLIEPLLVHQGLTKTAARKRMLELLDRTGIAEPHKRFDAYPHMLSGGQRQRAMIAMALACSPRLLIADEPTTALDVTIQMQILDLLEDLQKDFSMAVLLITHNLNMVRRFADRVCVMEAGRVVEQAGVSTLFQHPQHAYTQRLLASRPERLIGNSDMHTMAQNPVLLAVKDARCYFPVKAGFFRRRIGEVKAVDQASITLRKGETLGIVGESGSGKTTLGMCALRLQECQGERIFGNTRLSGLSQRQLRPLRKEFQVVFQDPYSSLSPRMTVEQIIGEGLHIHFPHLTRDARQARILKVLQEVDLDESMLWRYPHEFSGGQRQRIAIARVVVLEPQMILLDEPTSALDATVQKQVLQLLRVLQNRHGISYLFITHDLAVIRAMAHRVVVMRHGQIVEQGDTETLFVAPQNGYTRTLLQASLFNSKVS